MLFPDEVLFNDNQLVKLIVRGNDCKIVEFIAKFNNILIK